MDMRRTLLLALAFVFSLGMRAQGQYVERYNVLYFDMTHGLPNNFVDDIYADSDGFMWIATHGGGLVRYDGYSVLDFGVGKTGGYFRSNSCRSVCEDGFHRLWVSFDECTEVLDLETLKPASLDDKKGRLAQLLQERSIRVHCDAKGRMWIVTMDNIYCVSFLSDGKIDDILQYAYNANTPDVFLSDIDGDGSVWVAFGGALHRLSVQAGKLVSSSISPQLQSLPVSFIIDVVKHGGKVWIATNVGLFLYDPYVNKVSVFTHTFSPTSLSHNYVSSLAVSADDRLMVGTLSGVDVLNESTGEFEHWDTGSAHPLSSNFVNCMLSVYGQVWVGTEGGGVVRLVPRQLTLQNFVHTEDASSLSQYAVNAMYVEPGGTLWVGTVEGGLNRHEPGQQGFTHYTTSNTRLSHNSVSALAGDSQGRLWVGTWAGGINVLRLDNPTGVEPLSVSAAYQPLLNFIGALAYDGLNDGLWIGSNDGVYFYDFKSREMMDPFEGSRNFRGCIGSIITKDGHLWMGCLEGAVVVDLHRPSAQSPFRFRHLKYKLDAPESGIIDKITCFCEASDGSLWIGSNGYGLYKREVDEAGKEAFKAYHVEDGLANNAVKGIVEGQDGMLWITTVHGLSHFNPKTEVFTNFHEEDGLVSSQFYWNSAIKGNDGVLYLGTEKGLVCVTGEKGMDVYKGRLHFTQLTVANQQAEAGSRYIAKSISHAKSIRLSESDKSFTIEFSALHYGNETQGIYYYRMRGFEREWTPLPSGQHSVRYTSLPSGNYVFEVKYESALDNGEDSRISIAIDVTPYFWKSWWFVSLMLLALTVLASWLYRWRTETLKKREAERLMRPIEKVLRESDAPEKLQERIQSILSNQRRFAESSKKSVEADAEEMKKSVKPFMDRVMGIMEKNYMNSEFGVMEFCEQMGMSRSLLAKKLNQETGQSTSQFIRNYRLDIAKQILKRGDQRNIAEIAFSVGFNDPKYFTRCFTKLYGVSPSAKLKE